MKAIRWVWAGMAVILSAGTALLSYSWFYTYTHLASARSDGVYASAEEGMLARIDRGYPPDRTVKILHAGTNSFDGSQPHVWYVIAEVRADHRLDGSSMGPKGCDGPGNFFLQTREGWVFMPEGAFPEFIGFWMKVFGWAGEGQSTPSTPRAPGPPARFCQ
jgi:hypothetical protein